MITFEDEKEGEMGVLVVDDEGLVEYCANKFSIIENETRQ
jgi:hypothetical protein